MRCFLCHKPLAVLPDGKAETTFCDLCLNAGKKHPDILERAVIDELETAINEIATKHQN